MVSKLYKSRFGIFSFLIVLLLMPIGHALMIFIEKIDSIPKFLGAGIIGLLGLILLVLGIIKNKNMAVATIFGLLAGVLIWTGWVEFSFVWIAEKNSIAPLIENGEVATKPEYLVMMSSVGLLSTIVILFMFSQTRCQFFNWFQKVLKFKKYVKLAKPPEKPIALITFIETIVILWTFYILLLLVYDNDIAGDKHPLTYIVAFGSLFWSIYLFLKLIKINTFDYAIRYAVPTVIIFWNFIEVTGRWNLFKEIWVHPFEHWKENLLILAMFFGFVALYIRDIYIKAKEKSLN